MEQFKEHDALKIAEAREGSLNMRVELPPANPALTRAVSQDISLMREWFHTAQDKLPEKPTADGGGGNLYVGRSHFGKVILKGERIAIQPNLQYARDNSFDFSEFRAAVDATFNNI